MGSLEGKKYLNLTNFRVLSLNHAPVVDSEQIVMTPLKKAPGCTSLLVERQKKVVVENGAKGDTHVAGGAHQGLVINKREGGM
jgi:hypothetical protein